MAYSVRSSIDAVHKALCAYSKIVTSILLTALLPAQTMQALRPQTNSTQSLAPATGAAVGSTAKLNTNQRILHLLNRFTFGPTPEEIAYVESLAKQHPRDHEATRAIDEWFEQQLNPKDLPSTDGDATLGSRLAEYPAMDLPVAQLLESFPSGTEIRQTAEGKHPVPDDPILAGIYLRHIALLKQKQAQKAEQMKALAVAQPDQSATSSAPTPLPQATTISESMASNSHPTPRSNIGAKQFTSNSDPNRPTYGDLEVKTILALSPDKRVDRILKMQLSEYDLLRASLKAPQKLQLTADLTPGQRELLADYDNPSRTVVDELQAQRLLRDIYSSHQLQEVMTTFWLNHFNIYLRKNETTPYYLVEFERDVIAPRALGNFEDLLDATATSPAMMIYLDNSASTGPDSPFAMKQRLRTAPGKQSAKKSNPAGLNENYARELMELHTLGVNGGYTQKDVTEVARVFSGWGVDKPNEGGGFRFDETRHDSGKKVVMGKTIKENGQKEGFQLLHMLATSPATAHFISQKLAIAFVSDDPPATLVKRMAQSFLKSKGDIPTVLRTMIHSPEFWAPASYQAKVKTPLEYVVSAIRASGANVTNAQPLVQALNQMGMPLYSCVPPTGYGIKADDWVSTGSLVTRMNFGLSLGTNHFAGIQADWTSSQPGTRLLLSPMAGVPQPQQAEIPLTTPLETEQRLASRLIPTGISDKTRTAILNDALDPAKALAGLPAPSTMQGASAPASAAAQKALADKFQAVQAKAIQQQDALLAGLLLGSPEFQRR